VNKLFTDKRVLFILGPSGVGKSSFGGYLESQHSWLHLEADPASGGGIEFLELRTEWDAFFRYKQISPLESKLRKRTREIGAAGCVITFSGSVVLDKHQISLAQNASIELACLYGAEEFCLRAFNKRERESGRRLAQSHWLKYSPPIFEWMEQSFAKDLRINVFDEAGNRRSAREILYDIDLRSTKDISVQSESLGYSG